MPSDYYSLVTNNGLIKEAQAGQVGGTPLNLTKLAVGDGNGSYYEPSSEDTSLVNEVYRTDITSSVIDSNNPNQLIIEGVIPEEAGEFYVREIGIFDSDGDLFAIGKYPETFKSSFDSGSGKRLYIRMILAFVATPNVEVVISEDINFDPNFQSNLNDIISSLNATIASLSSKINDLEYQLEDNLKNSENLSDLIDIAAARDNLELLETATTDFTGAIIAFAISSPLDGWLECNGAAVSRTSYANLFSKIGTFYGTGDGSTTFNLPDLRGEFIRGYDHGRGVDSGRTFGSFQNQSTQTHKHSISGSGGSAGAGSNPGSNGGQWDSGAYSGKNTYTTLYSLGGSTHPRNRAFMYCIKY